MRKALVAAAATIAVAAFLVPAATAKPIKPGPAGGAATPASGTDWAAIAFGGTLGGVALGCGALVAIRRAGQRRVVRLAQPEPIAVRR